MSRMLRASISCKSSASLHSRSFGVRTGLPGCQTPAVSATRMQYISVWMSRLSSIVISDSAFDADVLIPCLRYFSPRRDTRYSARGHDQGSRRWAHRNHRGCGGDDHPDRPLGHHDERCFERRARNAAAVDGRAFERPVSTPTSTPPPDTGGGSTGGTKGATGNAANGKTIFTGSGTCGGCHALAAAGTSGAVGPALDDLKGDAAKAGEPLDAFIKSSIEDPGAFVAAGYPDGVMPTTFGSSLSASDINDLVAFISSAQSRLPGVTVAPPAVRTGAHVLVEALEAHGVEVVFGLPGIHALPVWDALIGSPIRRVVVRHEQAAGFGAVGYARTGAKPGVYLTSTGPGAFNSLVALSEADASSAPVLHLTSQIPTDLVGAGRGYLHESRGQSQAFAAVSRFHARPTTPEALAAAVAEARPHGARPRAGTIGSRPT